jgi:alpha-ketoglutaric semialdehyde dehydrogenase
VVTEPQYPHETPNWINGVERTAASGDVFDKVRPADGRLMCRVSRSRLDDARLAVDAACRAQPAWAELPPVKRGEVLHEVVLGMMNARAEIAQVVAEETGKSYRDAEGEVAGAISLGLFYASEGQRLYGRTTTSSVENRLAMTIRQPVGVAGLIVAANTPIANVAWKVFPALVCGNSAVLKAAEDTPVTAWLFGRIAREAGLPAGVLNILQGLGPEAGQPVVEDSRVGVVSFTGSTEVGRLIQRLCGERLAKVSLELGGKNPFVVCDDADLDRAVKWALLSAFSNAGQRCASASRIIVFDTVYDAFRDETVRRTERLRVGSADQDDLGPVINGSQLDQMLAAIEQAREEGATVLTGGERLLDASHRDGFFLSPTVIEGARANAEISRRELFGPICLLFRVRDFGEALSLANDSPYGLTAAIHTRNVHRALRFCDKAQAGVVIVNAGTYGSEPHMPFGGLKASGNGTREPGTEALDIYSQLKDVYLNTDPHVL